jgi:hypothetical protein
MGATVCLAVGLALAPATAQTTGGQRGFPGLGGSGELVSRSGSTLEIESPQGATSKVIVNSSTDYRRVEATDDSAITKGACVRVAGDGSVDEGIAATSVTVLDGAQACSTQAGGVPGGQRPDMGDRPTGSMPEGGFPGNGGSLPEGRTPPDGATPPGGAMPGGFGGGVTGTVKSVDGDTLVVTARVPKQGSGRDSTTTGGDRTGRLELKKQKVDVTLGSDTAVSHTLDGNESDLVAGVCVTTQGSTDSVGTVTAETVTISQPENGACSLGFGAGGGFGPPPGEGPGGSESSGAATV